MLSEVKHKLKYTPVNAQTVKASPFIYINKSGQVRWYNYELQNTKNFC